MTATRPPERSHVYQLAVVDGSSSYNPGEIVKLEMRVIEAKERSLKQRRVTKSSMALYKRDDDERELIFLRAHWERHVLQWRLLSCEALLGVCHRKLDVQAAEIKHLKRKCNQRLRRVHGANGR